MEFVKFASFLLVAALIASCGGSGGSSNPASGSNNLPTSSAIVSSNSSSVSTSSSSNLSSSGSSSASLQAEGIFDVNYAQFSGVYTFLDNGDFSGVHFVGTLAGHPHGTLTQQNSISSREHIAWANFVDDTNMLGTQEANGLFGRTFTTTTLSVSITGSMGSFRATAIQQKKYSSTDSRSLYNDPLPLTTIAGNYTGYVRTVGISKPKTTVDSFVIADDGSFTTTVVDCTFSGKLIQHGNTGVFDTQVATSGGSCSLANPLKGIVIPLSVVNDKPQLAVQLDDLNNAQTAVFIINK